MGAVIALFTGLCCFRKKSPAPEKETGDPAGTSNRGTTDLQPKEPDKRDSDASESGNNDANLELPLPPARIALRETYSCNNMVMKCASKKKLSTSLTVQITRGTSMSLRQEGEVDKSVKKKKKLKAENSILVRPIILGEKCRVPSDESDEDSGVRMQKNRTYHPRSMSSISLSRTNSRIDLNVIPGKETPKDSISNEGEEEEEERK